MVERVQHRYYGWGTVMAWHIDQVTVRWDEQTISGQWYQTVDLAHLEPAFAEVRIANVDPTLMDTIIP